MRRTLTFTAVAAGGLVATGAALWALAEHGDGRFEPLLVPTVSADRLNGAPRPNPAARALRSLEEVRAPERQLEALA